MHLLLGPPYTPIKSPFHHFIRSSKTSFNDVLSLAMFDSSKFLVFDFVYPYHKSAYYIKHSLKMLKYIK